MKKRYTTQNFGVKRQEGTLKNGLKTVLIHKPYAPIRMHLIFRAGSVFDPPGKEGLAHFVEHVVMNGSSSNTEKQFWDIGESIGAYMNAKTKKTCAQIEFEIASKEHLSQAREYFTHAVSEIYVNEQTMAKEKNIVISEIEMAYSRPNYAAEVAISAKLTEGSVWGTPNLGSIRSVLGFTVQDVENFFKTHYTIENAALIIAGDSTWKDIERTFSSIPLLHGELQEPPQEPDFLPQGSPLVYEDGVNEVKIYVGFRLPQRFTRKAYLLQFALSYAHGNLGTLFPQRIRVERGLAYSISLINYCFDRNGYIGTRTGTPSEKVPEVLQAIRACYQELVDQSLTQKQINDKIKTMWYCGVRDHEQSVDWVNSEGLDILYPDPPLPFKHYPDIYNYYGTFTAEEIKNVLSEYIEPYIDNTYIFLSGKNAQRYI